MEWGRRRGYHFSVFARFFVLTLLFSIKNHTHTHTHITRNNEGFNNDWRWQPFIRGNTKNNTLKYSPFRGVENEHAAQVHQVNNAIINKPVVDPFRESFSF